MNFMCEWQERYLMSECSKRVRYCFCHENKIHIFEPFISLKVQIHVNQKHKPLICKLLQLVSWTFLKIFLFGLLCKRLLELF